MRKAILFNIYTKNSRNEPLGFSLDPFVHHYLSILCLATSAVEYSRRFAVYGAGRRSSGSSQSRRILQDSKAASLATYLGIRDRRGGSLVSNSLCLQHAEVLI